MERYMNDMERCIKVNDITLKGIGVFDENLDLLIPLSDVRKALQLTPTADVVPRGEVEAMQRIYGEKLEVAEALIATLNKTTNKAKQDVAKEIFEDLQGLLVMRIGVKEAIAELKKKYMEEKK